MTDRLHQEIEAARLASKLLSIAPRADGHSDRAAALATLLLLLIDVEQGRCTMADTDRAQQELARVWPGWWCEGWTDDGSLTA